VNDGKLLFALSWDDAVRDECASPTYRVTAARIDACAKRTGNFTPVPVNEE